MLSPSDDVEVSTDFLLAKLISLQSENFRLLQEAGTLDKGVIAERLQQLENENKLLSGQRVEVDSLEKSSPTISTGYELNDSQRSGKASQKTNKKAKRDSFKIALANGLGSPQQQPLARRGSYGVGNESFHQFLPLAQRSTSVKDGEPRRETKLSKRPQSLDIRKHIRSPHEIEEDASRNDFSLESSDGKLVEPFSADEDDRHGNDFDSESSTILTEAFSDSFDVNDRLSPTSFAGPVSGMGNDEGKAIQDGLKFTFEFCIVEADLKSLIPTTASQSSSALASSPIGSIVTHCFPGSTLNVVSDVNQFCFPSGVSVDVCSRSAAQLITGSHLDQFHIMQFTDSFGVVTFACSLCVTKLTIAPSPEAYRALLSIALHKRAARRILKALQWYSANKKKKRWSTAAALTSFGKHLGQAFGAITATSTPMSQDKDKDYETGQSLFSRARGLTRGSDSGIEGTGGPAVWTAGDGDVPPDDEGHSQVSLQLQRGTSSFFRSMSISMPSITGGGGVGGVGGGGGYLDSSVHSLDMSQHPSASASTGASFTGEGIAGPPTAAAGPSSSSFFSKYFSTRKSSAATTVAMSSDGLSTLAPPQPQPQPQHNDAASDDGTSSASSIAATAIGPSMTKSTGNNEIDQQPESHRGGTGSGTGSSAGGAGDGIVSREATTTGLHLHSSASMSYLTHHKPWRELRTGLANEEVNKVEALAAMMKAARDAGLSLENCPSMILSEKLLKSKYGLMSDEIQTSATNAKPAQQSGNNGPHEIPKWDPSAPPPLPTTTSQTSIFGFRDKRHAANVASTSGARPSMRRSISAFSAINAGDDDDAAEGLEDEPSRGKYHDGDGHSSRVSSFFGFGSKPKRDKSIVGGADPGAGQGQGQGQGHAPLHVGKEPPPGPRPLSDHDSSATRGAEVEMVSSETGSRSLRALFAPDAPGRVVVAKKAYCIITSSTSHAMIFKVLRAMADAERHLDEQATNAPFPFTPTPIPTSTSISSPGTMLKSFKNEMRPADDAKATGAPKADQLASEIAQESIKSVDGSFVTESTDGSPDEGVVAVTQVPTTRIDDSIGGAGHRPTSPVSAFMPARIGVSEHSRFLPSMRSKFLSQVQKMLLVEAAAAVGLKVPLGASAWVSPAESLSTHISGATSRFSTSDVSATTGGWGHKGGSGGVDRFDPEPKKGVYCLRTAGYIDALMLDRELIPTTKQWTTGLLLSCLSSNQISKIINLLLMEQSLVIVGENVGLVTSMTFAVTNLIAPFSWEGVFVPLVPDTARELFGAPVPFILGTTRSPRLEDLAPQAAVLYISAVLVTNPVEADEEVAVQEGQTDVTVTDVKVEVTDVKVEVTSATKGSPSKEPSCDDKAVVSLSGNKGNDAPSLDGKVQGRAPGGFVDSDDDSDADESTSASAHVRAIATASALARQAAAEEAQSSSSSSESTKVKPESKCSRRRKMQVALDVESEMVLSAWFTRLPEVTADMPIRENLQRAITSACNFFGADARRHRRRRSLISKRLGVVTAKGKPPTSTSNSSSPVKPVVVSTAVKPPASTAIAQEQVQGQPSSIINSIINTPLPLWPLGGSPKKSEKLVVPQSPFSGATSTPSLTRPRVSWRPPTSLDVMFMSDVTRQERNCVDALLGCITHHNMKFTGDMSDPSAWRQYVRHNATTNEDEFIPSLFMDPIRSQVEFQELMVKTQLFVGFVDRIRSEYNGLEPLRIFICNWLYFRFHLRRQRQRRRGLSSTA